MCTCEIGTLSARDRGVGGRCVMIIRYNTYIGHMVAAVVLSLLFFMMPVSAAFKLGVENISDKFLRSLSADNSLSYRVGLISNQTGRDQRGNRTVDILLKRGLTIPYILAPEHGFEGRVRAGVSVKNEIDRKTGIPIISMYSSGGDYVISSGKRINPTILSGIDIIFFDIQDSGMRHYTYISTLLCALEAAAQYKKTIVVLDRPNLLGAHMEGPVVDTSLRSFISIASIPLRHGMTVGELARYFNTKVLATPAELRVVPMKDYTRTMKVDVLRAGLSPNLQSLESCYGYSFLGILGEIEPFDVCVGTPLAFQVIALPDTHKIAAYEWNKLHAMLARKGIKSSYYSYYNRKRKQTLSGLRLHIADIDQLDSFAVLVDVLKFFRDAGVTLSFSQLFDKAVGTSLLRGVCKGFCEQNQLVERVGRDLDTFIQDAKDSLLYEPAPRVVKL